METNYSKRTFNLGDNQRRRYAYNDENVNSSECRQIPKIEKGITYPSEESPVGSFLIRLILCITIFSGIMLMKNSTNGVVSVFYDAIEAWSTSNYTIPEEYSIEKFVNAVKSGNIVDIFSKDDLALSAPCNASVLIHYGDKSSNGSQCLGVIFSSDEEFVIHPSLSGTVTDVFESETLGRCVTVSSDDVVIKYGFCNDVLVSVGDEITLNTVLADSAEGNDGKFYAYVEVTNNGRIVNPEECFQNNEK